jgi:hypothetical protein
MKLIRVLSFFLIGISACTTALFVSSLRPTTAAAFAFFALWLITPHLAMSAGILLLQQKGTALISWCVAAIIVSIGGVVFLTDAIFLQPDAQGAIAVLVAPLFQGVAFAVMLPLISWVRSTVRA